jgi:hypothetical protein
MSVTENNLSIALRERLRHINAEWRKLSREQNRSTTRLRRLNELRSQRLAKMAELFDRNRTGDLAA